MMEHNFEHTYVLYLVEKPAVSRYDMLSSSVLPVEWHYT